jgi:hypothetical protein
MFARTIFARLAVSPRAARRTRIRFDRLEDRVTPTNNIWNAGSGDWAVDGNWSLGHVPTGGEDAVINTAVTVTHDTGADAVNSVAISGGGSLVLSGGSITDATTLDAPAAGASFSLSGGTLAGATVTAGSTIAGTGGTLTGVTLDGTLDLTSVSGANATIVGGLTLGGGTVLVGAAAGPYGYLTFDGTQTLGGTGTVVFGSSALNLLRAGPSAGSNLTIGPNVVVRGQAGYVGYSPYFGGPTGVSVINQGTLRADVAGGTITVDGTPWSNTGTIQAAGGIVSLAGSWTNSGTIDSAGDQAAIAADPGGASETGNTATITTAAANSFTVGQSVIVAGVDVAGYNGTFTITAVSVNTFSYADSYTALANAGGGTATLNSAVNLGGTFATTDLGTVTSSGGTVSLTGVLTNTGNTLTLNASTGSWWLAGGTIIGGTIATAGGTQLLATTTTGILNGVTLTGTLAFDQYGSHATVTGGMTLNGGTILIGDNQNDYGYLSFDGGNQTLGGTGTVLFGNNIYNFLQAGPTLGSDLTIGPNILIHGNTGSVGYSTGFGGSTNVTFTNQGTIEADVSGGTITLDGNDWTNTGTVQATGGANLDLFSTSATAPGWTSSTPVTISGGGTLDLRGDDWTTSGITLNASTLNLGGPSGTFTVAGMGTFDRTGGTVNITGTLDNTGQTLSLDATTGPWLLAGGGISGGTVATSGPDTLIATTLGGTLSNGVTLSGTFDLSASYGSYASVNGGLTLAGGTVLIGNNSNNYAVLRFDGGSQTLGGTGTVLFGNSIYNFLQAGFTANSALTIGPDVLVDGQSGSVGYSPYWGGNTSVSVTNQGTIQADVAGGAILVGNATNYAGGTLTGGTWAAINGSLELLGANITTNAANIILDGAASKIYSDLGNTDALTGLTANAAGGSLTVRNGRTLTLTGQLTNDGDLTVGTGGTLVDTDQYASSVIAFSSQYSTGSWSAAQTLGPPNTLSYGDISTSWAPSSANGTQEFLTLGFANPDFSDGAIVRETYGNGFVTEIDAVDTSNVSHVVWTGTDPSQPGTPVDFLASWPLTAYRVAALTIHVDTNHNLGTFEEIDSVQLVGPAAGFTQGGGTTTVLAGGTFDSPAFTQTGGTTEVDGTFGEPTPPTGGHLTFDGLGDTVEAPDSPSLDLSTGMTLEAWIDPTAIVGNDRPVISKVGGAAGNNGYEFGVTADSRLYVEFNAQGQPWGSNLLKSAPLELQDTWSDIAATFDGTTESLYLNGRLVASQSVGPLSIVDTTAPLRISGDANGVNYFAGQIDEARVWNVARTPAELQADAGHTLTGSEPGLVGDWPLDEGTGTTAFDQTANHNDGVLGAGNASQMPAWVATTQSATVDMQGGTLTGSGTISADVTNAATVAVDQELFVGGDYTQTAAGSLAVTIGGPPTGPFGNLVVDGSVSLDGNVSVGFANSFFPSIGNAYTVLDNAGPSATAGHFVGVDENGILDAAGPTTFHATYLGGSGNDLVLTPINLAPTLDAISDPPPILQGAGLQTVNLTGIGSGNTDAQTLHVTATSDNPALIPDPTVTYSSPDSTGSLTYAPLGNGHGTAHITVTVTDDGGTALGGVDTVSRTFTVVVQINPEPPTLDSGPITMLDPVARRTKPTVTPPGTPISNLLTNATDPDGDPIGLAITGLDPANVKNAKGVPKFGVWQYTTDGGTTWTNVPDSVSPTAALVLAPGALTKLRFLPNVGFQGLSKFTFLAWDESDGATPGTQVDTTAAPESYSSASERAWVAVGKSKPAVDAAGATLLAAVKEDAKSSRTFAVKTVIGIAALESLPATGLGIAITGMSTATGTWQFKLAGSKTFTPIDQVSATHALLLRPTDILRFIPAANANGNAGLTFKTWVSGAGFGTYADPTTGTGFGNGTGAVDLPITAVDDAPVLDPNAHPSMGSVNPGDPPLASTIARLNLPMTDVDSPNLGIQVLSATGGLWEYSKDGGTTWIKITRPVFLNASDEIRFSAPAGAAAGTATLSFKAWDGKLVSKAKDALTVTIV